MPRKKSGVRQLLSDEERWGPSTSTPSAKASQPPAFGLQTIQKQGMRVIRRVPSSPSETDSNRQDENDQLSSPASSTTPPKARLIRPQHQQNDQLSSPASSTPPPKARLIRPQHQQDNERQSTTSRRKGKIPQLNRSPSRSQRQGNANQQRNPRKPPPKKKKRNPTSEQEIRRLQRSTELLIPRLSFSRLVRELLQNMFVDGKDMRWGPKALEALHEAAEYYLVEMLEYSYMFALHALRVTLFKKDIRLARRVMGKY